jgi:hypothetical protein
VRENGSKNSVLQACAATMHDLSTGYPQHDPPRAAF